MQRDEEELKYPAAKSMLLKVGNVPTGGITAYQFRHKILVLKPNVILKRQMAQWKEKLGIPLVEKEKLTNAERRLAEEFKIDENLATQVPAPFNPYQGIERVLTFSSRLTASGSILRYPAPEGYKLILLDLAAYRPSASAQAYLKVTRDDIPALEEIDLYCMQGLENPIGLYPKYAIRIVAVDYLDIELDVKVSGTYRIRTVVGIGKLTLPEKIKWGIELTPTEEAMADRLRLEDKIKVGIL